MKLSCRNQKNAVAVAAWWNKPLDNADWYKVNALSADEAEILIYDVIGWPFNDARDLVNTIGQISQGTIVVRINSPGGDVFDALSIFNALSADKSHKIITRIEALAASSASIIALAGAEVQAYKNTMYMIHEPWSCMCGDQHEMREVADILQKISANMVDIYADHSKVGKKEIRDMLQAETWFTAKEAKERGFIDTIVDGKVAQAKFDLSVFDNVPDDLIDDAGLTERDAEKALRDAGFSRSRAKAMLAGRRPATDDTREIKGSLEKLISTISQ